MLRGLALLSAVLLSAANAKVCDIYASGGTPCVAAHSTVRALYDSFTGPMYQVKRADGTTKDIHPLSAGGIADAASQDAFCTSKCVISIIYDQSGKGNHLTPAPPGSNKNTPDDPAVANRNPITIQGKKAYGVWIDPGMGYRNNNAVGTATGDASEAMYMVASGTHINGGCCFDYGNAERSSRDEGERTMEAIYFGNIKVWGYGQGSGPWLMADLERGLYGSGNGQVMQSHYDSNNPSVTYPFSTLMLKGRSGGTFALKSGNAASGRLTTTYDGARPGQYKVMLKKGAIILGIGGDNSNSAAGTFYEGCMVTGDPNSSIDDQVQADIVAAGYGSSATMTPTNTPNPTSTTPRPTTTSAPTTTPAPTNSGGGAQKWGQCGGIGFSGPTSCAQGKCVKLNDYYSQCQ